jgi:hypothetical protein
LEFETRLEVLGCLCRDLGILSKDFISLFIANQHLRILKEPLLSLHRANWDIHFR